VLIDVLIKTERW